MVPDEKARTEAQGEQSAPDQYEIKIDSAGPADWGSALKELEDWDKRIPSPKAVPKTAAPAGEAPAPKAEPQPSAPAKGEPEGHNVVPADDLEVTPQTTKDLETAEDTSPVLDLQEEEQLRKRREGMKRYEELCKTPSMKIETEDLKVINELSDILSAVNSAISQLKRFEEKHPYLIAPNVFRVWEDNLKETSSIMFREFHNLRNGKKKKVYDKRYVCNECHSVFMMPLPEGICDECRSRKASEGSAPY